MAEEQNLKQELEKFKYPNSEEYNVGIKEIFHKWITKAINEKNKDCFMTVLKLLAKNGM